MVTGVLYWAAWRVVPRWFGYEYVSRKETLSDGTVVTLVRLALRPRHRALFWASLDGFLMDVD